MTQELSTVPSSQTAQVNKENGMQKINRLQKDGQKETEKAYFEGMENTTNTSKEIRLNCILLLTYNPPNFECEAQCLVSTSSLAERLS